MATVGTTSVTSANEKLRFLEENLKSNQAAVANFFNTLLATTAFGTTGDVLVYMHNILSNIIWCRIGSWIYLGISIASICVGSIYIDLCTVQYMIPLYLIIAGSFGLVTNIIFVSKWITSSWGSWTICTPGEECAKSFFFSWTLWLLWWFNAAWFIAGSVWIFGVHTRYHDNYVYHADSHLYVVKHYTTPSRYLQTPLLSAPKTKATMPKKKVAAAPQKKVTAKGKNKATLDDTDAALAKDFNFDVDMGKSIMESIHDFNNGELSSEHRVLVDVDQAMSGKSSNRDGHKQALGHDANSAIKRLHDKHRAGHVRAGHVHTGRVRASRVRATALPRHPFCHRGLYEYAFWITIVEYIMIFCEILFFLSIFCGCCPFAVVAYTEGTAP